MPPTPHPTTPSPLTIVVCESVPTSVSGYATVPSAVSSDDDDAREIFDVDLMDDAGVGRHDPEVAEGVLSPAQERVALLVARELELGVQLKRVRPAEVIDLHRVIDDELHRLQRIDAVRIAAEPRDAVAHRREIDDRRHAGEILQQHARRRERDFPLRRRFRSQRASASMSAFLTNRPSSCRSRFSSRIFIEYGRRAISGNPAACRAGRL